MNIDKHEITPETRATYERIADFYGPASPAPEPRPYRPQFTVPMPKLPDYANTPGQKIYLIRCGDFIKIGTTENVARRVRGLLGSTPHDLSVICVFDGGRRHERELHKFFAPEHHRDDWFHYAGALRTWIEEGCPTG